MRAGVGFFALAPKLGAPRRRRRQSEGSVRLSLRGIERGSTSSMTSGLPWKWKREGCRRLSGLAERAGSASGLRQVQGRTAHDLRAAGEHRVPHLRLCFFLRWLRFCVAKLLAEVASLSWTPRNEISMCKGFR